MSFLNSNNSEFLSARITKKGRQSIAEGNFNIKYFQIGDSEFDYNVKFGGFTGAITGGTRAPHQRILAPLDGDQHVKYPYLIDKVKKLILILYPAAYPPPEKYPENLFLPAMELRILPTMIIKILM